MSAPKYLLVIGSAKSGTSSLFRYLADHPDVCGSSLKETYFFAPDFDAKKRHSTTDSIEQFTQYFDHASSNAQLRVEATPFTMYGQGAAERIAAGLDDVRVLCLAREPVARFVSDYRFLKQRDSLGEVVPSPAEFAERQLADPNSTSNTLSIGRYADVLPSFVDALGADRVDVAFFEELTADPAAEMERLAAFYGLAPGFFTEYEFKVINKTIVVGNPVINTLRMKAESPVRTVRNKVLGHERAHQMFERVIDAGRSSLERLSESETKTEEPFPQEALDALREHYAEPNARLVEIAGRALPAAWDAPSTKNATDRPKAA